MDNANTLTTAQVEAALKSAKAEYGGAVGSSRNSKYMTYFGRTMIRFERLPNSRVWVQTHNCDAHSIRLRTA